MMESTASACATLVNLAKFYIYFGNALFMLTILDNFQKCYNFSQTANPFDVDGGTGGQVPGFQLSSAPGTNADTYFKGLSRGSPNSFLHGMKGTGAWYWPVGQMSTWRGDFNTGVNTLIGPWEIGVELVEFYVTKLGM